jgi:hypothetical protein
MAQREKRIQDEKGRMQPIQDEVSADQRAYDEASKLPDSDPRKQKILEVAGKKLGLNTAKPEPAPQSPAVTVQKAQSPNASKEIPIAKALPKEYADIIKSDPVVSASEIKSGLPRDYMRQMVVLKNAFHNASEERQPIIAEQIRKLRAFRANPIAPSRISEGLASAGRSVVGGAREAGTWIANRYRLPESR